MIGTKVRTILKFRQRLNYIVMNNNLRSAIQDLYTVFSKYPGNRNMEGSPNYGSSIVEWNQSLFSKSLAKLSDDDLSRFVGKAMTTWGGVGDLKHFIPRILELTAQYQTPYEIWIALDKLELANWKDWEENEKKAILNYLESLLENILNDESDLAEVNFIDYLTSIIYFYPYFDKLLIILEKSISKAKYKHLSNFIVEQSELIFRKGKIDGFKKYDKNVKEFQYWLVRSSFIQELSSAFFKYEREDFAHKISWAEQLLSNEIKNAEQ